MHPSWRLVAVIAATAGFFAASAACGASSADSGTAGFEPPKSDTGVPSSDTSPTDTAPPPPPPEREVESSYRSPVATGKYVWIANPTTGRVAYIDAATLDVKLVDAGNGPTYLAAVPGTTEDVALVLNVLSDDATMLKASGGIVSAKNFSTHHGGNTWAVSGDGHWAIAWTSAKNVTTPVDKTEGFQDLTVIDLTGKVAPIILAVGYRPVSIGFTKDGSLGYAVTQDGVSLIDLTGASPLVTKNVAISDDPLEDPGTRDVNVTPDGSYAIIRRDGQPLITIVSLETSKRTVVTLSGNCTDLDLSEDGKRAVAVVRDKSEVAILAIPGIVDDPKAFTTVTVTGETIGSVSLSPTGSKALLYTNAVAAERFTVMALDPSPSYRVVKLYAPVLGIFPTPDAQHAIVLHDRKPTDIKAGAFSAVPIGASLPAKIVGTDAKLTAVAVSPSSDRAVITERDDIKKIFGAYLVRMPALAVDRYALASPPIAVGVVAGAGRAYVAQEHAEGRITFIDLNKGLARTLTGFELNARVVDGSKP
jgi:hypothetical protein